MKANLEFNLPEEKEEFKDAIKGTHYRAVIDQTFNFIRNKLKYDPNINDDQYDILSEVRDFIVKELEDSHYCN